MTEYFTARELSKKTGISVYEIRGLGDRGKIDTKTDSFHGCLYPETVLKQLKDLGYLGIPESVQSKNKPSKIWVSNGQEERYISIDDPIPDGFTRGRAKHIRDSVSKSNSGKLMVHRGRDCKMIPSEKLPEYLSDGWKEGRIPGDYNSTEGRITINNGVRETFIEKIDPIPDGWEVGRLIKSGSSISEALRGRVWVHKDSEEKRIPKEDESEYISNGWARGRLKRR